jgi:hypothetical protein
MVQWVGTNWKEIPTIDDLIDAAFNGRLSRGDKHIGAPWAQVDGEIVEHLQQYQALTPAPRQPPAQLDWLGL